MATLEEITNQFKTAVGSDSGLGKSVKFDLKPDGVIYINGGTVNNEDLPADCTISVAKDDFEKDGRRVARSDHGLHAGQAEGERRYVGGHEAAAASRQGAGLTGGTSQRRSISRPRKRRFRPAASPNGIQARTGPS